MEVEKFRRRRRGVEERGNEGGECGEVFVEADSVEVEVKGFGGGGRLRRRGMKGLEEVRQGGEKICTKRAKEMHVFISACLGLLIYIA